MILFDFATVLVHYAMHTMSVLWPFHKIHHSAEVLTPVTLFRMHPVDLFLSTAAVLAFSGAGLGLFGHLTGGDGGRGRGLRHQCVARSFCFT